MKLLHTADWHLGKQLEGYSRIEEQAVFLEWLVCLCEKQAVDMVLLAGDVYDNANPSAEAERLFYQYCSRLSDGGRRPVVVIAGNHDSPERLMAANALAYEQGIFFIGLPKTVVPAGKFPGYEITDCKEGCFTVKFPEEEAVLVTMPYPTEKRLQEFLHTSLREEEMQETYSRKIGSLFRSLEQYYREDTINLAMGHFYTAGGIESGSERPIQLGGSMAVHATDLPERAQYIALGHLHRPQTVGGTGKRAFYAGSPLAFHKDEGGYQKSVNLVTLEPGKTVQVERVPYTLGKAILLWEAFSVEEAIAMCQENAEAEGYVYLTIYTQRVLEQWEIKQMRTAKKDIVEIVPVFSLEEKTEAVERLKEKSLREEFCDFYMEVNQAEPTAEMVDLFLSIVQKEE